MVIKIPALICCALYNVRNVRWLSRFNTTHKFSSGFLVGSRIELLELAIDQKFGKCLNCVYNSFLIEYVSKRDPTSLPPSIFRRYKNGNIFLIIADELQTTAGSSPLNTIYTDNLFIEIFPFFFFYFLNLIFSWRGTRQNVKFSINLTYPFHIPSGVFEWLRFLKKSNKNIWIQAFKWQDNCHSGFKRKTREH